MSTQPTLIILCSVPGGGKTTYATHLCEQSPEMAYICPDDLRLVLTGNVNDQSRNGHIFETMVPVLLSKAASEGRDCLYDATNVTRKNRAGILDLAKSLGYRIEVHVLQATLEECLKRNTSRAKRIPDSVILRMHSQYQAPDRAIETEIDEIVRVISWVNPDGSLVWEEVVL